MMRAFQVMHQIDDRVKPPKLFIPFGLSTQRTKLALFGSKLPGQENAI